MVKPEQGISAEVRLYYRGRSDWDTKYFTVSTSTDLMIKAAELARAARADHYCYGQASEEDNRNQIIARNPRVTQQALDKDPAKQIKRIAEVIGLDDEDND